MENCDTGILIDVTVNSDDKSFHHKTPSGSISFHSHHSYDDDVFSLNSIKPLSSIENTSSKCTVSPVCGKLLEINSSIESVEQINKHSASSAKKSTVLPSTNNTHLLFTNSNLRSSSDDLSLLDLDDFELDLAESPVSNEIVVRKPAQTCSKQKFKKMASPMSTDQMIELFQQANAISTQLKGSDSTVPKAQPSQIYKSSGSGSSEEYKSPLVRKGTFKLKTPSAQLEHSINKSKEIKTEKKVTEVSDANKGSKLVCTPKPASYKQVRSKISQTWKHNSSQNTSKTTKISPPKISKSFKKIDTSLNRKSKPKLEDSNLIQSKVKSRYGHITSKVNSGANSSQCSEALSLSSSYSNDVFLSNSTANKTSIHNKTEPKRTLSMQTRNAPCQFKSRAVSAKAAPPQTGPMKAFTPLAQMVKKPSNVESTLNSTPVARSVKRSTSSIPTPGSFSQFQTNNPLAVSTPNNSRLAQFKPRNNTLNSTPGVSPVVRPNLASRLPSRSPRISKLRLPSSVKK